MSLALGNTMYAGLRIAGSAEAGQGAGHITFYPQHINQAGKKVSARVVFKAYENLIDGKSNLLRFTAWGKNALTIARSGSVGKDFACLCKGDPYQGRVWYKSGQMVLEADGTPLLTGKFGYNITRLIWGAGQESAKVIEFEIQNGIRPPNWNNAGHPDYQAWQQVLIARNKAIWDGQSAMFGFAKVEMPNGTLDFSADTGGTYTATDTTTGQVVVNSAAPGVSLKQYAGTNLQGQVANVSGPVYPAGTTVVNNNPAVNPVNGNAAVASVGTRLY